MSKRTADQSIINDRDQAKKPRKKTVKSIEGVSQEDFKNTDLKARATVLKQSVKTLAKMVDDDWHDGHMYQDEEVNNYLNEVEPMLQAVYNISVKAQKAFERCHEIIKLIADTWDNMKTIPMRGTVEQSFEQIADASDMSVGGVFSIRDGDEMIKKMWPRFLLAAASCSSSEHEVTDAALARFIKDADDFGVDILSAPEDEDEDENENQDKGNTKATSVVAITSSTTAKPAPSSTSTTAESKGLSRLTAIYGNRSAWSNLPTTRKVHKQKSAIDRRFFGSKNRRTRDFSSDDDGDYDNGRDFGSDDDGDYDNGFF
mmetsp:Transcript_19957/g.33398  ORF Transcript_19957/g.33398 Transcript_19957/m.33398 type:complete len:315 (+) Transcript_19957:210-1154(+)|eukprot:CAMPEP_0174956482 /NCGR_PEP_ID=MMETSP0004_2-20121128/1552_1 /TAXON_ID=420556 /ORGANISM="Ochromonas sp., Strain CCMP1393" /LENGTH=314 /DNA_ID=CAMNT_0016204507 /DNA_START=1529 /DNA_END=2473 /DNA_ORIENTATION=-